MKFAILIVALVSVQAMATCLDSVIDQKVSALVLKKAAPFLLSSNKTAVPPGLPEGEYPKREAKVIVTVQGNALVAIYFAPKDGKISDGFVSPYNFNGKTQILRPIGIADLGNGSSRFWDAKFKTLNKCKRPHLEITYDTCQACGGGNDLTSTFSFNDQEQAWEFIDHH